MCNPDEYMNGDYDEDFERDVMLEVMDRNPDMDLGYDDYDYPDYPEAQY